MAWPRRSGSRHRAGLRAGRGGRRVSASTQRAGPTGSGRPGRPRAPRSSAPPPGYGAPRGDLLRLRRRPPPAPPPVGRIPGRRRPPPGWRATRTRRTAAPARVSEAAHLLVFLVEESVRDRGQKAPGPAGRPSADRSGSGAPAQVRRRCTDRDHLRPRVGCQPPGLARRRPSAGRNDGTSPAPLTEQTPLRRRTACLAVPLLRRAAGPAARPVDGQLRADGGACRPARSTAADIQGHGAARRARRRAPGARSARGLLIPHGAGASPSRPQARVTGQPASAGASPAGPGRGRGW